MLFFSPPAVRFGRIPKREKQRLLDEMQSYMNSLNESSSMNMETSPPQEPPSSPDENQSKEAIGALSRAYQDIFTTAQDRMNKRSGNINTSSRSSTFQNNPSQDANFSHANPHPGYHSATQESFRCQVAPTESKCPVSLMDNNRYSYAPSFNQNHTQSEPIQTNYNSYPVGEPQSQTSCPLKLPVGSKVLVRNISVFHHYISNSNITFMGV